MSARESALAAVVALSKLLSGNEKFLALISLSRAEAYPSRGKFPHHSSQIN
jgi:hypothetical protein